MAGTQYIETDNAVIAKLCDGREIPLQKTICVVSKNESLSVNGEWDSVNKCYKWNVEIPEGSATFDDIIVSSQLVTTDLGGDGDIDLVEMEYTTAGGATFKTDITALISTMTDNDDGTITHSTLLGDFTISLCKLLNDSTDNGNTSLPTDKVLVMQADGSCELKTIGGGGSITANNDLGLTSGTLQTGFPLVRDTVTTGAYYRHWSNNSSTNPAITGRGLLTGYRYNTFAGYNFNTALTTGNYNLLAGGNNASTGNYNTALGHLNNTSNSYNLVSGYDNENSMGTSAIFGYQNGGVAGNYNFISGFRNHANFTSSGIIGQQIGTASAPVRGNYSLWTGYLHSGNANYSGILGYRHNVTGSYNNVSGNTNEVSGNSQNVHGSSNSVSGSNNSVSGLQSTVSSRYNAVNGYMHNVSSYGNTVGGYRQTVTANRSLCVGDLNTVSGTMQNVVGYSHEVAGDYNSVLGYNNTLSLGSYSFLSGRNNTLAGTYSGALGYSHDVTGTGSFSIGYNNTIDGNYDLALGRNNILDAGRDNIMIGRSNNPTSGNDNIAVGKSITTNNGNSVVIGGSGQKLGFFNAIPIAKQTSAGVTTVAQLVTKLQAYGLLT